MSMRYGRLQQVWVSDRRHFFGREAAYEDSMKKISLQQLLQTTHGSPECEVRSVSRDSRDHDTTLAQRYKGHKQASSSVASLRMRRGGWGGETESNGNSEDLSGRWEEHEEMTAKEIAKKIDRYFRLCHGAVFVVEGEDHSLSEIPRDRVPCEVWLKSKRFMVVWEVTEVILIEIVQ